MNGTLLRTELTTELVLCRPNADTALRQRIVARIDEVSFIVTEVTYKYDIFFPRKFKKKKKK